MAHPVYGHVRTLASSSSFRYKYQIYIYNVHFIAVPNHTRKHVCSHVNLYVLRIQLWCCLIFVHPIFGPGSVWFRYKVLIPEIELEKEMKVLLVEQNEEQQEEQSDYYDVLHAPYIWQDFQSS